MQQRSFELSSSYAFFLLSSIKFNFLRQTNISRGNFSTLALLFAR